MRVLCAVAMIALLAGPAYAQTAPIQKYGDPDKEKTQGEIEAEKRAEKAYQRSLGNVPNASGPVDPWGNVRGGDAQKTAAKPAPEKRSKPANPPN
ncbi:hypothetical protein [Rhodopseudomonas pseudopalustris]|uniref:Uncharacterized protein n=1 Tax=Rhodopseudomonas pseudopalustris TaxID=1513892 RepID=A0A1H8TCK1_9BRAD|nr:hypothetical protein [Rhodopseudomonas pseudopalustris]MBB1092223.1 hypothetical protein [Rhodopseudomonas palustris]SEO88657.1 hypothetical protein SAMN05444123_105346 [Rhodopseudomonas pseudopalustris]